MSAIRRVCIFSGSRPGNRPDYRVDAVRLGQEIARRGWGLVYGGASVGLMGAVADAAMAAGGEAIGVIPEALVSKEIAHSKLTKLHVVGSMHERKALMAELSDAFIALPGGFGTFEELFEIVTWAQLGMHEKPIALQGDYYAPLLALVDHGIREGFIPEDQRALIIASSDPAGLLDLIARYEPPALGRKWIEKDET
jgi:hypothetical protein